MPLLKMALLNRSKPIIDQPQRFKLRMRN